MKDKDDDEPDCEERDNEKDKENSPWDAFNSDNIDGNAASGEKPLQTSSIGNKRKRRGNLLD
jgi:hypothetical protein